MALLETRDLTFAYNNRQERPSLDAVNIQIGEGRRTAILGANGAGKSTLFYHFNGVLKPKGGEVLYKGVPLDYNRDKLRDLRSEICVVVQNPDEQIFSSTVEEDVAFGPMNMNLERDEVDRRIEDALDMVGMSEYRMRPSTQLSYGQRKRVSLAGALAVRPKVLILDEPTAGLDPQMSREVMELVDELCCTGTTVIISTHDVDLAYTWAEDIHVLVGGKHIFSGAPEKFFTDPESTALAGLCRPHAFSVSSCVASIRGEPQAPYPRTNSQALARLAPKGTVGGRVRLVPVSDSIPSIGKGAPIGAYGFKSKKMANEAGLELDYVFDALEMCMLDAVQGRDSVLLIDDSMKAMAKSRIERLTEFGVKTEVVL